MSNSTELSLQICFGIFGVIGTIATLASLHRHDSLGCVLLRRIRHHRIIHEHDLDVEASTSSLASVADVADVADATDNAVLCVRQPSLPPAYEQPSEGSRSGALVGSDPNVSLLANKATSS
ncbi:hypothetical protein GMOD_00005101 [Pyrenophora seminiperda CCB06]|uniref:Uncharacterized protein n=1 Tax=Pyrenophora seminiperda CCB06 TaxID=1302712 RepID=A0A3M7LUV5_9PLEO|nr:hypothetical protein GMOD_00005101 [Pyrenophora seminiperda CCB06]